MDHCVGHSVDHSAAKHELRGFSQRGDYSIAIQRLCGVSRIVTIGNQPDTAAGSTRGLDIVPGVAKV